MSSFCAHCPRRPTPCLADQDLSYCATCINSEPESEIVCPCPEYLNELKKEFKNA